MVTNVPTHLGRRWRWGWLLLHLCSLLEKASWLFYHTKPPARWAEFIYAYSSKFILRLMTNCNFIPRYFFVYPLQRDIFIMFPDYKTTWALFAGCLHGIVMHITNCEQQLNSNVIKPWIVSSFTSHLDGWLPVYFEIAIPCMLAFV